MSLSNDDITYIRAFLPYTPNTSDPLYVSDAMLNILYAGNAAGDLDKTIAYAMQQMCAKASNKTARSNSVTGDSVSGQQEREAICALAKQWAAQTGVLGGAASSGSMSLGIDEEDQTVTNP